MNRRRVATDIFFRTIDFSTIRQAIIPFEHLRLSSTDANACVELLASQGYRFIVERRGVIALIEHERPQQCIMKLDIWLPNWIGDVAMATPTLRALRDHFIAGETELGSLLDNLFGGTLGAAPARR